MDAVHRKITLRLYPNATQASALEANRALHCRVYNTLLEEHRRRHLAGEPAYTFAAMCRDLTAWRRKSPALAAQNAQSLQVTARRAALAFAHFFRRVRTGDTPGYPRFKAARRFAGWGYKTLGDGWKLLRDERTAGKVRLSGVGEVKLRGRGRFDGTPKTAEVVFRQGKWYLSVTYEVAAEEVRRRGGTEAGAFDWGVGTLLTIACGDGSVETVANPQWLRRRLAQLKTLQRAISAEEIQAKARIGLAASDPIPKGTRLPVTRKLQRLYAQVRALHGKIARQRHDFYHQLTAQMVGRFGALATEELAVANMVRRPKTQIDDAGVPQPNGAARKAGLNRGILETAPSRFLAMLRCKAAEAGSEFALAKTRTVKPTQRCHRCGALTPKALGDRVHRCPCGCECGRDENSARTLLRWFLEGDFWSGTGPGGVLPLPETPPIAA